MDKTIGKWLSLLLLTLFAANTAVAQKLSIEDFSIKAGETKEVTIAYEGEKAMHGYQTDITLSDGLTFASAPAEKDAVLSITATEKGTNAYRIVGYSAADATVDAGTEIVTFSVKADDSFSGGTITLSNTEISFEGSDAVNPENLVCNVTLETEEETGDKYALFTGAIEPGDYIIYYGGKAMNNTIAGNRLQFEEVTVADNMIVNPSAAIIWTVAADGSNYTLYNAAAGVYAASNGTRNQAAAVTEVTDAARWTVSGSETYEFLNVANSAASVNAYLRNNGTYGFACYSTGTGGALSLYKKVEEGEVVKPVLTESQTFAGTLTVEITADEGNIYYTTDGTDPSIDATAVNGEKYTAPIEISETTTVKAIAVVDGKSSAVASATYTLATPITIAEAQALAAGDEAFIEGVCVASAATGAVLYDGTDYIYYFNGSNDLEVGKSYSVNGAVATYGAANQLTAAAKVVEIDDLDVTVPTDVAALDAAALDATAAAGKVEPRQLASIEGTLAISGNYFNITVDGAETAIGSVVKPKEDISELDGKKVVVTGYEMYLTSGKYVYFVATSVEEAPAAPVIEEGVYYIYNETTGRFMSRGSSWGTRAIADFYGLPINVTLSDGKYLLQEVDNNVYYGDDHWMYADCSGDRVRSYNIEEVEGGYAIINPGLNKRVYINVLESDLDYCALAGNATEGENYNDEGVTIWKFLTQAERDEIVNARIAKEISDAYAAAGITEGATLEEGEPVVLTFKTGSAWTFTAVRNGSNPATNDYGTEVFQGTGNFTQTVTGLESGLYKVSMNAFFRDGANTTVAALYDQGYNLSNAYLDANGSTAQVPSWGKDRTGDTEPNGMSTAAELFAANKYLSETYAYVGEDGTLNLTVSQPNYIGGGWFIIDNVTYTKLEAGAEHTITIAETENGTVEADAETAAEGVTVTLTVTPDEGVKAGDVKVTYIETSVPADGGDPVDEEKEVELTATEGGYTFTMPNADVTVTATFRAKNEPGEYEDTPMTKDMFKGWDDFDDYAKVNNENPYWDALELPAEAKSGNTIYGSGNVTNTDYADITGATTLRINGTPGIQLRVLINRQADNSLTELNPVIGEDGYADVDLSSYEYVHVNAIKLGWGSPDGTVESLILNPSEEQKEEDLNWTFDVNPDDVITVTTQGYARNIPEGSDQIAGLQPVTGWTPAEQTESDPGYVGGIFAYGSENLLNNKVAAPAAAPEGSESPSALGLAAVWNGVAQYTQPIELPAGSYKFTYTVYNGVNTGVVKKNLFGLITEDGTEYLSDKTTFTVGEWETVEVAFTLEEATKGNLSVGFIGEGGSGTSPHLFVDNINVEQISDADVAKDELEKAIAAAQAKDYVIGDELFQYPESEIQPLTDAIAAAQAVYDNEEATADEVKQATETLNNFVEAFDPAYNEPVDGQAYTMKLTTLDGQFWLCIDGNSNLIEDEDGTHTDIYFDKQDDGTWGMKTEDGDYIAYEGSNKWTMSTSTEPYGWTITALPDGGVSIAGQNGLYGTNTSDGNNAGSPLYGDKTTSNGNYVWNIEPVAPEVTEYNGTLTQTMSHPAMGEMGSSEDADYTITISEPDADGNVTITYKGGFTMPVLGMEVPEFSVTAKQTVAEDGSITYSNDAVTVSVPRGAMEVNYTGSLEGTQESADATPTITLTLANATTDVIVFGPAAADTYKVIVNEAENGLVEADVTEAAEGATVTLTVTPDEGYELESIKATTPADEEDAEPVEVELTEAEDGTYTFTMPAGDVTVTATFKETEVSNPDYAFVASEWQAGDPGRILPENVVVDEDANTITVNKTGNQNVNLQYKGDTHYNVGAESKYFVVKATGCTPDGGQLWWMNNDWIGTITPEVYTVGEETLFAWPLESLKKNGGNGEPISLASDTEDAEFWNDGGWSTCFGLTLADPDTPAVISLIGFTDKLPEDAVGINRISIDGTDFAATIDNALRNGKVFDISGRKVGTVVKGGIYIVDGVKVVIRK